MALARIISSSRECARELAVSLLDRGYAVEIVSPDAIPDDVADLELRVESDPAQVLSGSVQAHDGVRSAALQFLHHLKTPMPDFRRRPPGSGAPASLAPVPVIAGAMQNVVEKVEVPLSPGRAPEAAPIPAVPVVSSANQNVVGKVEVSPSAAEPPAPVPVKPNTLVAPAEVTGAIATPVQLPTAPKKAEEASKFAVKIIIPKSKSPGKWFKRGGWFGRAALTSAAVLLAALALGLGTMRPDATAPISNHDGSGTAGTGGEDQPSSLFAAPIAPMPSLPAPEKATPPVMPSAAPQKATPPVMPGGKDAAKPAPALKNAAVPLVKAAVAKSRHAKSRRHLDDVIAPDTVTYFDEAAKPVRIEQFTHHLATPPKRGGGVVAAKTVTDPNGKTAP